MPPPQALPSVTQRRTRARPTRLAQSYGQRASGQPTLVGGPTPLLPSPSRLLPSTLLGEADTETSASAASVSRASGKVECGAVTPVLRGRAAASRAAQSYGQRASGQPTLVGGPTPLLPSPSRLLPSTLLGEADTETSASAASVSRASGKVECGAVTPVLRGRAALLVLL